MNVLSYAEQQAIGLIVLTLTAAFLLILLVCACVAAGRADRQADTFTRHVHTAGIPDTDWDTELARLTGGGS